MSLLIFSIWQVFLVFINFERGVSTSTVVVVRISLSFISDWLIDLNNFIYLVLTKRNPLLGTKEKVRVSFQKLDAHHEQSWGPFAFLFEACQMCSFLKRNPRLFVLKSGYFTGENNFFDVVFLIYYKNKQILKEDYHNFFNFSIFNKIIKMITMIA